MLKSSLVTKVIFSPFRRYMTIVEEIQLLSLVKMLFFTFPVIYVDWWGNPGTFFKNYELCLPFGFHYYKGPRRTIQEHYYHVIFYSFWVKKGIKEITVFFSTVLYWENWERSQNTQYTIQTKGSTTHAHLHITF